MKPAALNGAARCQQQSARVSMARLTCMACRAAAAGPHLAALASVQGRAHRLVLSMPTAKRAVKRPGRFLHAVPVTAAATSAAHRTATKRVVITGGSKGFGFAMAREFLLAGDSLVICGRDAGRLKAALSALQQEFGQQRVHGTVCDMSDATSVAALGAFAQKHLGCIDIWINNAGEVTAKKLLADVEPVELSRVVGTNVLGSLLGCREAIRLLRAQPHGTAPQYHIFNLGFSQFGAQFSKSAVTHKATKMALKQLNESLAQELQAEGLPFIGVHNLSPGMVLTDLLLKDSNPIARRFFNALAEEPETVAAALVPQIRTVQGTGNGVDYLTPAEAFLRILKGLPQIINGGRFFDKNGDRVAAPGEQYQANGVREQF